MKTPERTLHALFPYALLLAAVGFSLAHQRDLAVASLGGALGTAPGRRPSPPEG